MRLLTLIPTECMTSDSLTKPMVHHSMLNLLNTGTVRFHNEPNHPVISRILPAIHEYDEDDLMKDDEGILEDVKEGRKQVKVGHATIIMGMFAKCFNQKVMMASMFAVGAIWLKTPSPFRTLWLLDQRWRRLRCRTMEPTSRST